MPQVHGLHSADAQKGNSDNSNNNCTYRAGMGGGVGVGGGGWMPPSPQEESLPAPVVFGSCLLTTEILVYLPRVKIRVTVRVNHIHHIHLIVNVDKSADEIHLSPKWQPFYYSFISMKIHLSNRFS